MCTLEKWRKVSIIDDPERWNHSLDRRSCRNDKANFRADTSRSVFLLSLYSLRPSALLLHGPIRPLSRTSFVFRWMSSFACYTCYVYDQVYGKLFSLLTLQMVIVIMLLFSSFNRYHDILRLTIFRYSSDIISHCQK